MRQWNTFFSATVQQCNNTIVFIRNKFFHNIFLLCYTALLLLYFSTGCAKITDIGMEKPTVTTPPASRVTFQEYLSELNSIESIKFIFSIKFQRTGKNNSEELNGVASFIINQKRTELKVYSHGFLISEVRIENGEVISEGKKLSSQKALLLMEALKSCLMWWQMDEIETETLTSPPTVTSPLKGEEFILMRNFWRKVYLNKDFIPERQEITLPEASIQINYQRPLFYPSKEIPAGGIFYPSKVIVRLGDNMVNLNIEKIVIQN